MNWTIIFTLLGGLLGGGTIVGIINAIINKGQRKATLFETIQGIATAQIEANKVEIINLKNELTEAKKERTEVFTLYKECIQVRENLVDRVHDLEIEIQKLRNELLKQGLFKQEN